MTLSERQEITVANFIHLAPGTVVTDGYREGVALDNGYIASLSERYAWPAYSLAGWRVKTTSNLPGRPENVDAFKQRVRTVCVGAAFDNSVSREPVYAALRRLGCDEANPALGIGMAVAWGDRDLRARINRKRNVKIAWGDPNHWATYGESDPNSESVRLGGTSWTRAGWVVTMDDPETDVYLRPPTEEDTAEIARLRGLIWSIGVEAKRVNSWCPAFENAVGLLGVSSESMTRITAQQPEVRDTEAARLAAPGTVLASGAEVRALPVGAIVEYPHNPDRRPDYARDDWCWMRRAENASSGTYGTRNYLGPNSGQWGGLRVVWDGRGEMEIPLYRDLIPHLPIGTVLKHGDYRWRKVSESGGIGMWARQRTHNGNETQAEHFEVTGTSTDTGFFTSADTSPWVICYLPDGFRHGTSAYRNRFEQS